MPLVQWSLHFQNNAMCGGIRQISTTPVTNVCLLIYFWGLIYNFYMIKIALYVIKWVHDQYFYWVNQIGVPWVGEVMKCKFQKFRTFDNVSSLSSKNGNMIGNALTWVAVLTSCFYFLNKKLRWLIGFIYSRKIRWVMFVFLLNLNRLRILDLNLAHLLKELNNLSLLMDVMNMNEASPSSRVKVQEKFQACLNQF